MYIKTQKFMVLGVSKSGYAVAKYILQNGGFCYLYEDLKSTKIDNFIKELTEQGDIEIDMGTNTVTIHGEPCYLPRLQYQILLYLLENQNRIITRDQILIRFWGYDFDGNERVVDTHIKKLRKAIAASDCKITTVHKAGYRMEVPNFEKEKPNIWK